MVTPMMFAPMMKMMTGLNLGEEAPRTVQRLKQAQGMTTRVEVPFEGYWAQDDWDRSEP